MLELNCLLTQIVDLLRMIHEEQQTTNLLLADQMDETPEEPATYLDGQPI